MRTILIKCWIMIVLAAAVQNVHAQQALGHEASSYYEDDEFSESSYRRLLSLYGISGDSLERTVNRFKINYLQSRQHGHGPAQPNINATQDVVVDACNPFGNYATCSSNPCTYAGNMCSSSPPYATALGNFFDAGFNYWCGSISEHYEFAPVNAYQYPSSGYTIDGKHHSLHSGDAVDPIGKFSIVAPGGTQSARIGSTFSPKELGTKLTTRFKKGSAENDMFLLRFAVVLQEPPSSHANATTPFFSIRVYVKPALASSFTEDCCQRFVALARKEQCPGFRQVTVPGVAGPFYVKDWTNKLIDLSKYSTGDEIIVEASVSHCAWGVHTAYAYLDGQYPYKPYFNISGNLCKDEEVRFSSDIFGLSMKEYAKWEVQRKTGPTTYTAVSNPPAGYSSCAYGEIDYPVSYGNIHTDIPESDPAYELINYKYKFDVNGIAEDYRIILTLGQDAFGSASACSTATPGSCFISIAEDLRVEDCAVSKIGCDECVQSFAPYPGKKYKLSAWARTSKMLPYTPTGGSRVTAYHAPGVKIRFTGIGTELGPFHPNGVIIDGWQKIDYDFEIPEGTSSIEIELLHDGNETTDGEVLFDDVKVYRADGQAKSFVYDPVNLRLLSELDENHFATFYEYDLEGNLVRVKKETEKGIMTIRESFNNIRKQP